MNEQVLAEIYANAIAQGVNPLEVVHCSLDPLAQWRVVFPAPVKTVDLELLAVVELEQLHGQHGHRMQTKIGRAVADA